MNLDSLVDRFGASSAEPIHLGFSAATVVRLDRAGESLFHKAGPGIDEEADRLVWLGGTGIPCPRVLDRGAGWMLTSELAGRDASQPWPTADRPAVLEAMAEGLRALHSLTDCPFAAPFPGAREVVVHGDYCAPNVFIDPETLTFSGILDIGGLGQGDPYVDFALMHQSLAGDLNPQYGGLPAARRFVELCSADPDDRRIRYYNEIDH